MACSSCSGSRLAGVAAALRKLGHGGPHSHAAVEPAPQIQNVQVYGNSANVFGDPTAHLGYNNNGTNAKFSKTL